MVIERTKNAARGIVWGFIERGLSVLLPFATRTVMIKVLGAEYLGLSSLFTSILSVLSLTELGLGSAIVFSMYEPIARDDNDLLCALLNTYRKIYYVIGTIILLIGLILSPIVPKLITGSIPEDVNLYALYFVYLLNTVISYYLFAYKTAIFSAYQRNDLISIRSMIVSIASNTVKIIVLLLYKNYYVYIAIIPLATVLTNYLNARMASSMFPTLKCRGNITQQMALSIKKRVVGLLSFKIYNVVFTSVDTIVVSLFLGLVPLAIYNNYYYIQSSITGFITIIMTSMIAGIGNKMVTNCKEDNYVDFRKFVFMNGWIVSWCSICLVCLYQHFMLIWVGEELVFPVRTMILMTLYFLIPRLTTMTYTYREAAGLWWEDRFRPIIATVTNIVGNLLLVKLIGMDGVIISTLICSLFINIPWGTIILFKNYFKRSAAQYFIDISVYFASTIIVGSITYFICNFVDLYNLGGLMIKCIICLVVPNVCFFIIYNRTGQYRLSKQFVCSLVRKCKKKPV